MTTARKTTAQEAPSMSKKSKKMSVRKRAALAMAAMAPAAGWALPAPAIADESGAQSPDQPTEPATPRFDSAAEAYAAEYDVSVTEASERLAQQEQLDDTLRQLRQLAGDRFAGNWIEHRPDYRAVVRLTGPVADQASFDTLVAEAPAAVEVRTDAPLSLAELEAERAKVQDEVTQVLPEASTGIHVQTGSVMVYAPAATQRQRSTSEATIPELGALTDAPVRVEYVPGRPSLGQAFGGDRLDVCTSGFSVVHSATGQRGIITAGHCGGPDDGQLNYQGYAGQNYPLAFHSERQDGVTDIGFYTTPGHDPFAEFYASSQTWREVVQGFSEWAAHDVGDWVCHQGRTTGYSCGQITDRASTACATAVTCSPNWVIVEGQSLACFPGDSGGPWFVHGRATAWGIYHGQWTTGTAPGQCQGAVYSPIDFKVTATGTQLMVG
jgi:streptogrisin C